MLKKLVASRFIRKYNESAPFGFAYDSLNNNFKILRIVCNAMVNGSEAEAEIYTLSSGSWRKVVISMESLRRCEGTEPKLGTISCVWDRFTFYNGALLAMAVTIGYSFILSFDISNESFHEIMMPRNHLGGGIININKLAVYKGLLAYFFFAHYLGNEHHSVWYHVWVMEEYGVAQSWTRKFVIPMEWVWTVLFFGCTNNGELLIENGTVLVSIDPESQNQNILAIEDADWVAFSANSIESLVLLDGDYLEDTATQAIMFQDTRVDPNLIVVAFRGTYPFDPKVWRTDVDLSWYEFKGVDKTHSGFMKALSLQKNKGWPKEIEQRINQKKYAYYEIRQRLRKLLEKNENAKFILTGHSLGGALAILFLIMLAKHEEEWLMHKLEGVYTFGQPRVGDYQLGGCMEKKLKPYDVRYLRFVYCNDMVPRVPYDDDDKYFFTHFGPCLYYNSFYKGKILKDEPNKNYFSATWAIFKFMNAVWKLIRSFIIPYTSSQEYKESWLMKIMRIFGLVFPVLAEHLPPDYVNVTRLGSLPLGLQDCQHFL